MRARCSQTRDSSVFGLTPSRTGAGDFSSGALLLAQHGHPESGRRKWHDIPRRPADQSVGRGHRCSASCRSSRSSIPSLFNLLLLYTPPSGSPGVTTPVIVEQFLNLSLANIDVHDRLGIGPDLASRPSRASRILQPRGDRPDAVRRQRRPIPAIQVTSTTPGIGRLCP